MARTFLLIGALGGVVGVALGAFGAHGLRGRLAPDMVAFRIDDQPLVADKQPAIDAVLPEDGGCLAR